MAQIFEPGPEGKIKSEWKVASNHIGGDKMYAVYRMRNISEVDHSGNREYAGGWMAYKQAAIELAAELNKNKITEEVAYEQQRKEKERD